MRLSRASLAAALCVAAAAGCEDKRSDSKSLTPTAAPVTSALPVPADSAPSVVKFLVDAEGKTSIDMPAPLEHIKAGTTGAGGNLDVDITNLANTRGQVKIDLATLKTRTFGDGRDAAQTEHASTWLEVNEKTSKKPEEYRWAVFTIRSIDGVSNPDPAKVPPVQEGSDEVRTVNLTVHGDLLLHGHSASKDCALELRFHRPPGARAGWTPLRVDINSKSPLHVVLAEHDVRPRDDKGILALKSLNLLGTKVAETADVTLALHGALADPP